MEPLPSNILNHSSSAAVVKRAISKEKHALRFREKILSSLGGFIEATCRIHSRVSRNRNRSVFVAISPSLRGGEAR